MSRPEELRIYKKALDLIGRVYELISTNKTLLRDYSLCDQLKRASVSILTNIAEGYFRSKKQSQNYLEISSGSANEVISLLKVVELIYKIDTIALQDEFFILGKQINSFASSFNK